MRKSCGDELLDVAAEITLVVVRPGFGAVVHVAVVAALGRVDHDACFILAVGEAGRHAKVSDEVLRKGPRVSGAESVRVEVLVSCD